MHQAGFKLYATILTVDKQITRYMTAYYVFIKESLGVDKK